MERGFCARIQTRRSSTTCTTRKGKRALERLVDDPFQSALRSHKLKGQLAGSWACSVDYDCRIVFEFVQNLASEEDDILLLTIGSHDEVY